MKKINKYIFIILMIFSLISLNKAFAVKEPLKYNLKDFHSVKVAKGTFFKGVLQQEVSSKYNKNGDIVRIINPFNVYLDETVIIPKNSVFIGRITDLNLPSKGRDAHFSIPINVVIFPDGTGLRLKAHVWSKTGNVTIGGNESPRISTKTVIHTEETVQGGFLQIIPDGERIMGNEIMMQSGIDATIQLDEDLHIQVME